MKVALVHDWLTGMRGGEKCLEVFCEMFPTADLFTLLYVPGTVSESIARMNIHTSPLQRLPFSKKHYRYYLPFFPSIIDSWETSLDDYDLVLSSSHCVAKGTPFPRKKRHVCYCFTPIRYIWCQTSNYYSGNWKQWALRLVQSPLKRWDLKSNARVDEFIGISDHVCRRIQTYYHRPAVTIYPPVDTSFYQPTTHQRENFFLMAGALEPYKRVDLAISAFRKWKQPLKIVGRGTMLEKLKKTAPSHVEFLGWQSNETIRELYSKARALIFPGEEDFGIVPLEAQACGCPIIAYGLGGVCETVITSQTGLFFQEPTPESLLKTLHAFESYTWNPTLLRDHAQRFNRSRFRLEMEAYLNHPPSRSKQNL